MVQSRPVLLDGRLVGLAVHAGPDWHFVAAEPVLDDLHGAHFPSAEEAARVARLVLDRARGASTALGRAA
jgi:hypothetical protein